MLEIIFDPYNYPFWIIVIGVISGAIIVISRPFSTFIKFVYPNAKFEAMGNPYIEEKNVGSVSDIKNLEEFKDKLNQSKDYKISGKTTYEIQQSLDKIIISNIQMMKNDSSKKMNDFYEVFLQRYDLYYIKKELKNKLQNKQIPDESIDNVILNKNKKLLQSIKDSDIESLTNILNNYGFSKKLIDEISKDEIDYLIFDNEIDKDIINSYKKVKVPYKCEEGKQKLIQIMIDVNNIKNLFRTKQLGYTKEEMLKLFIGEGREISKWKFTELAEVESVSQIISSLEGTSYFNVLKDSIEQYNKDKSIQTLENNLDRILLKHVKDISTQNYSTIGPTIRFLVSKEFEIRNLKVIAKGISEGLPADFIKKMIITEVSS